MSSQSLLQSSFSRPIETYFTYSYFIYCNCDIVIHIFIIEYLICRLNDLVEGMYEYVAYTPNYPIKGLGKINRIENMLFFKLIKFI